MSPVFGALAPSYPLVVALPPSPLAVPSRALVGIREKKITYGCRLRDKAGDHAGSLIASMAIDLATKFLPKFERTHRRAHRKSSSRVLSRDVCRRHALRSIARSRARARLSLRRRKAHQLQQIGQSDFHLDRKLIFILPRRSFSRPSAYVTRREFADLI